LRTTTKTNINSNKQPNLCIGVEVDFAKENPHAVANLIKMFLRELPEPILTWRLYDAFYQTGKILKKKK